MTHFYFHTWRNDLRSADAKGLDLDDQGQACDLAARDLGEMARDFLRASAQDVTLGIDIADERGMVLVRLRLAYDGDAAAGLSSAKDLAAPKDPP